MKRNIASWIAAVLSFISLVMGAVKLIPHFNKSGNPDQTWIIFIATAFPLMIFVYALAGTDENAKSVAPNSYGLVLTIPAIIASLYLGAWIEVICLTLVFVLILQQLFSDSNENKEGKKH
ncbi:hypothetical protein [Silvanigrella aquatica]|uniref:Uncharacterized protein n=1 Tax=Silvanigrella aquatica TaxID=1915309 RepID=A0A1L4D089_9BACT|nr:hypothetical protein [Silvanigrella aquatica]APJ03616.1 hypothetical protein AXG55_06725 [Silvanigrella aquatica]